MSVFAVSRVRVDSVGEITHVMWGVVDIKSNHWVSPEVVAPVNEVVHAIRNGDHVIALFPGPDGHEPGSQFEISENAETPRISLASSVPGRQFVDIDRLQL